MNTPFFFQTRKQDLNASVRVSATAQLRFQCFCDINLSPDNRLLADAKTNPTKKESSIFLGIYYHNSPHPMAKHY